MSCTEMNKELALEASGALTPAESARVRGHVSTCHTCAARLREYESVCAAHVSAADELHRLVLRPTGVMGLKQSDDGFGLKRLARWLVPVAGLGAAAALVLFPWPHPSTRRSGDLAATTTAAPHTSPKEAFAVATLGSYRQALGQEGTASLDSVLERDADLLLSPASPGETEALREELF